MTKYSVLDAQFHALADPTRRAMLQLLGRGEVSVSELARPHRIALPTALQHLRVLERGGLVSSRKVGRTRFVRAEPRGLTPGEAWIEALHRAWSDRLDRLEAHLLNDHPGEHDAS